jgi:outer membrane receptor protein involved in Fe transport
LSQEKTIQLSYSYRLSRPRYRDLLPYSGFSNNRVLFVGNPKLRPEFTHSIETGYLINWGKGSLLSSAYYRYRTGVRERIRTPSPTDSTVILVLPINLAQEIAYGLEFNFNMEPTEWFRFNTNVNFYRAMSEGVYEDQTLKNDTYVWTSRTTARLTIKKNWNFQASLNYRSPRTSPQGEYFSMYNIDLGLSKDIFKGKGTITFGVSDLFNTRKWRWVTDTNTNYSAGEFQWRKRQLMISLNYRLNRKKDRPSKGGDEFEGDGNGGGDF